MGMNNEVVRRENFLVLVSISLVWMKVSQQSSTKSQM